MKVTDIVTSISEVLQDADQITWTGPQVWDWIYDSELAVVLARPDANPSTGKLTMIAGTRQNISALPGALRILDVIRNVGASDEPGRAMRRVGRGVLDAYNPDWHSAAQTSIAQEYVFDDRNSKVVYVNPPNDGTGFIEVMVAQSPASYNKNDLDQVISVDDSYVPALIEWALYRAFSRDSDVTPNWQRAQAHRQAFFDILGVKSNSDIALSLKKGHQLD